MTRERAATICRQMNETVYPETMRVIFKVAKGGVDFVLLRDIVSFMDLLKQLPSALGLNGGRTAEEIVINTDELFSSVMRMMTTNADEDMKMAMMLRNAMYSLDKIRQAVFNFHSENFPDEENAPKQEVQEDERKPEEVH